MPMLDEYYASFKTFVLQLTDKYASYIKKTFFQLPASSDEENGGAAGGYEQPDPMETEAPSEEIPNLVWCTT